MYESVSYHVKVTQIIGISGLPNKGGKGIYTWLSGAHDIGDMDLDPPTGKPLTSNCVNTITFTGKPVKIDNEF